MPVDLKESAHAHPVMRAPGVIGQELRAVVAQQCQRRLVLAGVAAEKALIILPKDKTEPAPKEAEDARPLVYRVGKLPSGLPDWFAKLDLDHDGQIGLYEWKSSGRSLDEFEAIDRNNDGFLTVEEVLRYEAQNKERLAKAPPGSAGGGPPRMSPFGGPGGSSDGRGSSGFRGPRGSTRGGSR